MTARRPSADAWHTDGHPVPDPDGKCIACRAGAHRACAGSCVCDAAVHGRADR